MDTSFFSIKIARKRDVVIARQRARQVARILGYDRADEAAIAATVFALAGNCLEQAGAVTLRFHLRRNALQVVPEVADAASLPFAGSAQWSCWRLEKPLPHNEAAMSAADLAWSLQSLQEYAPANLFDEIEEQNDDLLELLRELRACQNELVELKQQGVHGAAA